MKRVLGILLTAASGLAIAQPASAPLRAEAFAWQWPIVTEGNDGAVRFALTPDVYARLTRADLRDLAAFNANGESMPLGPAHQAFERLLPPPEPEPVAVPMFRVPATRPDAGGDGVALHLQRAPDGTLLRLDAEVAPAQAGDAAQDLILDLSALDAPVTQLRLEIDPSALGELHARVEVAGSDDLAAWTVLAPSLAVVSLNEAGRRLERTRLDLAPTEQAYLRLRRIDTAQTLALAAVQALPLRRAAQAAVLPARERRVLEGTPLADTPGVFVYDSGGPFPVEGLEVILADRNSTADVGLASRPG
jgi:hypothetical protein